MSDRIRYVKSIVLVFTLTLGLAPIAQAGFVDSLERSADRTGKSVERKSGQRSDSSKYKNYRMKENKMRVQLPVSFKVTKRSASGFSAKSSKQGISLRVKKATFKEDVGEGVKFKRAMKEAKSAKNKGQIQMVDDRKINGVKGVETVAFKKKGDRTGPRDYSWEGWDKINKKHYKVTASFGSKKYDAHKYDFDSILNSIKWDTSK